MKSILYKDSNSLLMREIVDNKVVVIRKRDDYTNSKVRVALSSLEDSELQELVRVLNTINNQNIKSINNKLMTYSNDVSVDIGIENLCSAEKLYMVTYLAELGKFELILFFNMFGLERTQRKSYFKHFKSDNITIVADNNIDNNICKELIDNE
jgi:hypothetical protein